MSARWFMLTIPEEEFNPDTFQVGAEVQYLKGQKEEASSGYRHWQLVAHMTHKVRPTALKVIFGRQAHIEITRSRAAIDYVWKEETAIARTRFEKGTLRMNPSAKADWDLIFDQAKSGDFSQIPSHVKIRSYHTLKSIAKDHMKPTPTERTIKVFWGPTGTGKSHTAWQEATFDAFPKDPCTKFWDGYLDQDNVVIEEFSGDIGISHMLRWLDKYPVIVEAKHGAVPLKAKNIWITSNIDPRDWYQGKNATTAQIDALMRRLEVIHMDTPYVPESEEDTQATIIIDQPDFDDYTDDFFNSTNKSTF